MHWVLGKRRVQQGSAKDAAKATARATRYAAAMGLIGTVATVGVGIAAEVVDEEPGELATCSAAAIYDIQHLYDAGSINHDEFEVLRADAIADAVDDTGDC